MLKNWINEKKNSIIKNWILSKLHPISVNSGACRYNHRCQMNAVHEAIEHEEDGIVACLCIDRIDEKPFVHFININSDKEYFDNTLGHWSFWNDYYYLRVIRKEDFSNICSIFDSIRDDIKQKLPWYVSIFMDENFI